MKWIAAGVVLLFTGCGGQHADTAHDGHEAEGSHWTYGPDGGPDAWGALLPEYALCGSGVQQSPVDLAAATPADLPALAFAYPASIQEIVHNGHSIQATPGETGHLAVDGVTHELVAYHFHTPSEHSIDGQLFPMAMHLVHRAPDGSLAVVGVLFTEGDANAGLGTLLAGMPTAAGDPAVEAGPLSPEALLPAGRTYYRYDGSLTTPPCSEGVAWRVMAEAVPASAAQIAAVRNAIGASNRPVQPLGERTIRIGG